MRQPLVTISLASLLIVARAAAAEPEVAWRNLFNGKNLDGWVQRGGAARYEVKGGTIVGTSVPNTPNSFLSTRKRYGDFVLEYEFKVDERLNSGVMIRAQARPEYDDGRVHGYQVEIDMDSKRARFWTGGLYDEARRGWLGGLAENEPARKAAKQGAWNHIRVEAIGDSIKTFVNGVPAADVRDAMDLAGFIGLQVHAVGNRTEPLQVSWRNIRIQDLGRRSWVALFNGRNLEGWTANAGATWTIEDGILQGRLNPGHKWGILKFDKPQGRFTARVRYRVEKGNGGFYFRARPAETPAGFEGLQADMDTSLQAGGLYETGGRHWVAKPAGEALAETIEKDKKWRQDQGWNDLVVMARDEQVIVQHNGRETARVRHASCRDDGFFALEVFGDAGTRLFIKDVSILSEPVAPALPGVELGVTTSVKGDALERARDAGFDYAEIGVVELSKLSDKDFEEAVRKVDLLHFPVPSAILFLPGDLKVVGPDVDKAKQEAYLRHVMPRVKKLGLEMVVFGSGGARRRPDGTSPEEAFAQIVDFGRRAADIAKPHGITIVVESLRDKETNMINTAAEALRLVKAIGRPNFKMLVDYYHMALMNESPDIILEARKNIVHVQMANPDSRHYPMGDAESDYAAFFKRLADIGYRGRVSIEGNPGDNFPLSAHQALVYLRGATAGLARKGPGLRASR